MLLVILDLSPFLQKKLKHRFDKIEHHHRNSNINIKVNINIKININVMYVSVLLQCLDTVGLVTALKTLTLAIT